MKLSYYCHRLIVQVQALLYGIREATEFTSGEGPGFFLGGQEFFDPGTGRLEHFEASYNSS